MTSKIPKSVIIFLVIGLIAASQSANIIRLGQASPFAIATWRLCLASLMLLPFSITQFHTLARLSVKERWLLILAGATLALHFFAWIAAVQHTSVASATIFFSINPIITAFAAYLFFKEKSSSTLVIAIALGIAGTIVIGWNDFSFNIHHAYGDALAILCSVLFTIYFLLGKRLRPKLPTHVYVTSIYGAAALVGFVTMIFIGDPLITYNQQTWLSFFLMALIPTILGHTSFNHAVNYIPAAKISVATLTEPIMAALVAYFAWQEPITLATSLGYILICCSIMVLFWDVKAKGSR